VMQCVAVDIRRQRVIDSLYCYQCVAVCCSALQCVAVRCSGYRAATCNRLPIFCYLCVAVCCSVLQCVAVCCSVLQFVTGISGGNMY